jgi:NADPH:quinone reductase-like Zn-dependent oxidoreductase
MKALTAHSYGPVDQLTHADLPVPEPGPGQVRIRVVAAALNPLDVALTTGAMRETMPVAHPFVLGLDAAGVVDAVGEGVSEFGEGDDVVAFTYPLAGAVAEYTLAAEGPQLVRRPSGLDPVQAAALPVAGMTAAGTVRDAGVEAGKSVLIVGATGGVGSFAVQLAAEAGARVLATASAADDAYVRGLGAHETIDYTLEDTAQRALSLQPGGVDAVIDLVNAGPGLAATAAAAKPGGILVSPLGGPPQFGGDVTAVYTHIDATPGLLQSLVDGATAGRLNVEIGASYPFAEATEAVADFVAKHTRGKVVVTF